MPINPEQIKLPDTALTMIVRDEAMNPAGGIALFLDTHLPFVDEAVILDTGSIDSTRGILEEYQSRYPQLKVYDTTFKGFAEARNKSLSYAESKWALILDADELLTPSDFTELAEMSETYKKFKGIQLSFISLWPEGNYTIQDRGCLQERFVRPSSFAYTNGSGGHYERARTSIMGFVPSDTHRIRIKHFEPAITTHARQKKKTDWYENGAYLTETPLWNAHQHGWKELNPWRAHFPYPTPQRAESLNTTYDASPENTKVSSVDKALLEAMGI